MQRHGWQFAKPGVIISGETAEVSEPPAEGHVRNRRLGGNRREQLSANLIEALKEPGIVVYAGHAWNLSCGLQA